MTTHQATILAVGDGAETLDAVERQLSRRYGAAYAVRAERVPSAALHQLEAERARGRQVALLVAEQWMPEMTGIEFLLRAHELHPEAKRVLLIAWGDRRATPHILQAAALGQIDGFVTRPWGSPDEEFHKSITDFLEDWARLHRPRFEAVQIVGEFGMARCHELRDLLQRNGVPYGYYDVHGEHGQALLRKAGRADGPLPVVIVLGTTVLANSGNPQIAEALAANAPPQEAAYDLTVIGAGPAGLSAAVYAASEGLRTMVVEHQAIGGQAGTSSRIRNYLGFPRGISGGQLAARAYQQAWLFGTHFHFTREAVALRGREGERVVVLSDGPEIVSRAVVLAMGVSYRRLGIPRIEALIGLGVFYGAAVTEAPAMLGQEVFVAGGGNSAGQAALHLARYAARVTMLVRGESLAANMSDYLVREIAANANILVRTNSEVVDGRGEHRLQALVLRDGCSGAIEAVPAAALFVLIGTQPQTAWLPLTMARDEGGFVLTGPDLAPDGQGSPLGWNLDRPPLPFETSLPGVFAAGDVRHRSVKRVAAAVGEGSMAIPRVHQYLYSC